MAVFGQHDRGKLNELQTGREIAIDQRKIFKFIAHERKCCAVYVSRIGFAKEYFVRRFRAAVFSAARFSQILASQPASVEQVVCLTELIHAVQMQHARIAKCINKQKGFETGCLFKRSNY